MSPVVAFLIITWVALAVLFLGLAAVLREVRLLRGLVTRTPDGYATTAPDIELGRRFAGDGTRAVLAVDTGCPLCRAAARRFAALAPAAPAGGTRSLAPATPADGTRPLAPPTPEGGTRPLALLTHEPAAAWAAVAQAVEVVSDRDAWSAIAHLSPPVLMLVDGGGRVRSTVLPVREHEVDEAYNQWRGILQEGASGVVDARTDS